MDLQAETHVQSVFQDPFGELLRIEQAVRRVAGAARVFAKRRREDDRVHTVNEIVFAGEVAGEFVIGTVHEDELDLIAFGHCIEVLEFKGVGCAGVWTLHVDDLVNGFWDLR